MESKELLTTAKTYIIFEGVLAILFGLILMFWPGISVATFVIFVGVYGIVHGLISLIMGIVSQKGESNRGFSIATGALSMLFGIFVLNMPVAYVAFNLYVIAAIIGLEGIFLAIQGFTSEESIGHKIMLIIAGVLTLLFSIWVFFHPEKGGLLMILLLSLTLMISGALTIAAGSSIKAQE